jgi:cell division protein FtsQ
MSKPRHLRTLAAYTLGPLAVLLGLGFAEHTNHQATCNSLRVEADVASGLRFIDEAMVRERVLQVADPLGKPLRSLAMPRIEEDLRRLPCVQRADAYHTMDGVLHVRVAQRKPLVRVLDMDGRSFYLDHAGHTMPISNHWTARVPVVVGALREPRAASDVFDVCGTDSLMATSALDEVWRVAKAVHKDAFWRAMVDQIVVTPNGELELVPMVGNQRLAIGNGKDVEHRLAKLRAFYAQGMPQGDWRRWSRIDVRFAGQVVCTKRPGA